MDKTQILQAGVLLAETHGYQGVYKRHLAEYLKCGMGTINYHYGTMAALRVAMVAYAKRHQRHKIIMRATARIASGA